MNLFDFVHRRILFPESTVPKGNSYLHESSFNHHCVVPFGSHQGAKNDEFSLNFSFYKSSPL